MCHQEDGMVLAIIRRFLTVSDPVRHEKPHRTLSGPTSAKFSNISNALGVHFSSHRSIICLVKTSRRGDHGFATAGPEMGLTICLPARHAIVVHLTPPALLYAY